MTQQQCILAIDQGTTSSRAIVFDARGVAVASAQAEFPQIYPADGWVEHDPEAIWSTTRDVACQAFQKAEAAGRHVAAIGITNQRETTLIWDRRTGAPVYNAIVWQDRRTASSCEQRIAEGVEAESRSRTGLLIDPYFSATKVEWLLNHVDGARSRAAAGELAFGTVDSFLVWRLTGGRSHVTDATNASRTNLFNIHDQCWDDWLLKCFDVPPEILPEVLDCNAHFGDTEPELFGRSLPILGIAGDQQAAALGQCCLEPGSIKSTYGTGCFVILNTGEQVLESQHRLLSTVASRLDGQVSYALEGSIFAAGAAVQWLRDGLGVIDSAAQTEELARSASEHGDIYLVPAFTGLGAPYWKPDARGAIFGLTRATGPADLVRATLQAVAYQTNDLFMAMAEDGLQPTGLRVDGGMAANNWFVQFLADVLQLPVERPRVLETTAYGAALLAGQAAGVFGSWPEIARGWQLDTRFEPQLAESDRQRLLAGWRDAVERVIR
jgi:glycerol kinase